MTGTTTSSPRWASAAGASAAVTASSWAARPA
jgi:hypothetical protein